MTTDCMTDFPAVHVMDEHSDERILPIGSVVRWREPDEFETEAERVMWDRQFRGKYFVLLNTPGPHPMSILRWHVLDHLPTRIEAHGIAHGVPVNSN